MESGYEDRLEPPGGLREKNKALENPGTGEMNRKVAGCGLQLKNSDWSMSCECFRRKRMIVLSIINTFLYMTTILVMCFFCLNSWSGCMLRPFWSKAVCVNRQVG